MNEEEKKSIDKIENLIKYLKDWDDNFTIVPSDVKYFETILNMIKTYQRMIDEQIEEILDLTKEKEKNNELENADLTTVYMNGFYDGEKKWKDKIREIFDNYSQSSLMENNTFLEFKKELLEERN